MILYKDNIFTGVKVRLDNSRYESCIFKNCIIEYGGEGEVALVGNEFLNCQWVFVGCAQNTLNFMQTMYHSMGPFGKEMIEGTFNNIKNGIVHKAENNN